MSSDSQYDKRSAEKQPTFIVILNVAVVISATGIVNTKLHREKRISSSLSGAALPEEKPIGTDCHTSDIGQWLAMTEVAKEP